MLDGLRSSSVPVTSGVPQGSILGPLLFNIFMNSISEVKLSYNCRLILYADDIAMYKPIDSSSDLEDFQHDHTLINRWIEDHGLHTNHTKTCTNSMQLFRPLVSTTAHQASFFINVIPSWNFLHQDVIDAPTCITRSKPVCSVITETFSNSYLILFYVNYSYL